MSRATPRKSRHHQHPSNSNNTRHQPVIASDYESDAAQYLDIMSQPPAPPNPNPQSQQPPRDNMDISLTVLRRYQPDIRSILAIAANAVAYNFLEATQEWEKHGAEGTLFVCEQEPVTAPTGQVLPRACVFVLNRRSMENLVVDLLRVTDCEVVGELMVFRLQQDEAAAAGIMGRRMGKRILGLWIHADEALEEYIQAVTGAAGTGAGKQVAQPQAESAGRGGSGAGKRLSITQLFGQKNGG
ncbi:hypothetical protein N0V88_002131 [Collariella sp. IMI 366227]|nr:hypothetical protein N0V88_002131 [Collariella sp. IMI 366227]